VCGLVCAAVAAVLTVAVTVDAAETWTEVRSPNFRVITNGNARQGREVAASFERLTAVLQQVAKISTRTDVPLTIIAIQHGKQLRTLIDSDREDLGGLFAAGPDANLVLVRLDFDRDLRYQIAWHEYMHVLVHQTIGAAPVWLNEGLAEMYSQARLDTDDVLLGMPADYHLAALQERSLLSLERLLAVDHGSPEYTEDNRATTFYAQSWALTHFLVLGDNGAHRPRLMALLEALDAGATPADATRRALGDVAAFDRQFRAYIGRFQFPALKARVPLSDAAKGAPARPLSPAEVLALKATVAAMVGDGATGTTLAAEAVAADRTLGEAWMAQARAARRAGDLDATERALAQAVSVGSSDPLAHFGWAELRMRAPDAPLAEVSAALERALALKPDLARALSLLGVVRAAQDGNTTRGVSLITQAITLEPGNARHYLMLAQLAANARDAASTDAALARADRVAQGPDEKRQVAAVRQQLRPTP